jgi:hypothetical protein
MIDSQATEIKRHTRIELSGAAKRALREASNRNGGWVRNADELENAELERAGLVYDGAVTGEGYLWLRNAER